MQVANVFEQLVRIFNWFYAVNSTTEFLFELADSLSQSNWQWIGSELADNFSLVVGTACPLAAIGPLSTLGTSGALGPLGTFCTFSTLGPLATLDALDTLGALGPLGTLDALEYISDHYMTAYTRSPSLGACNYPILLSRRFHRLIYF